MESLRLFNTASRCKEVLNPIQADRVSIYTCGPTVYGDQHVGNYRTFIFEDVLVRVLRRLGYNPYRVMNITDVGHLTSDGDTGDDKLEVGAARDGITAWEVASRYQERFENDMRALGVLWPDKLVRATDTIDAQINMIQTLEAKGVTYRTDDGIYFSSAHFARYADFARLDVSGLDAGNRVALGQKRSPTDFALWKFSADPGKRHMEWQSPWGLGFPGWHIECSAIIASTLGTTIDIHCGGVDHIQVHHSNEIAQSEVAHDAPLSRIWMHGEFLLVDGGKMSKSLGNIYTLVQLLERGVPAMAFRLFTYRAQYRSKLNLTFDGLAEAVRQYLLLCERYRAVSDVPKQLSDAVESYTQAALEALRDDLNVPRALAVLLEASTELQEGERRAFMEDIGHDVLGLSFALQNEEESETPDIVKELVVARASARKVGDWRQSDALRLKIESEGYEVHDTKEGSTIRRKVL